MCGTCNPSRACTIPGRASCAAFVIRCATTASAPPTWALRRSWEKTSSELLTELGLEAGEVSDLIRSGIVGAAPQ